MPSEHPLSAFLTLGASSTLMRALYGCSVRESTTLCTVCLALASSQTTMELTEAEISTNQPTQIFTLLVIISIQKKKQPTNKPNNQPSSNQPTNQATNQETNQVPTNPDIQTSAGSFGVCPSRSNYQPTCKTTNLAQSVLFLAAF